MRPHYLVYTVLVISLAAMFLAGCSVRTVPLEEEQIVYEDEYYQGYDRLPPSLLYDTWQLSQYHYYYGVTPGLGYPLPYQMNIDPNPHDSYRADEQPVQRAPAHRSVQGPTANRRVGERRDQAEFQQRVNRSRHARSNRLAADSTEDRSRLRKQLQQRYRQRRTDTADDEDRKSQRRTTRRRARR